MRVVTQSLENAIESPERVVRHRVTVDWDNDGDDQDIDNISHKLGSVNTDQSLESTLPQQVRIVPGAAVAELNAVLARGNDFRYAVSAAYKSIATASSGSGTSRSVVIPAPAGTLPGEIVIIALFVINGSSTNTRLQNTNVAWTTLAIRGDIDALFNDRIEGQCYTRRAVIGEPSTYSFVLPTNLTWAAVAIRVGDPGLMGITAFSSKGQDDTSTTYEILNGIPITTTLPGTTIVSINAANSPVTGATWTPLDDDIERADFTTSNTGDQLTVSVMTADNVAPGTYIKRAALSTGASVTLAIQFTIAFTPKLAGDEYQHAAWTYSELNPSSPFAGKNRFGRRTKWSIGFHTEAGLEQVQVFTGLTIAGDGDSRQRSAEITAFDNRETMHAFMANVLFEPFVAEHPFIFDGDGNRPLLPGLETTFIISKLFFYGLYDPIASGAYMPESRGIYNGHGYFPSPTLRPSTMLWVPMHGSVWAFEGSAWWAFTQLVSGQRRRLAYTVGPFVAAVEPAPLGGSIDVGWAQTVTTSTFSVTKQILGRIELWAKFTQLTSGTIDVYVMDNYTTITQQMRLTITGGGTMTATLIMPGGITRTVVGPSVPTDGEWHFYGLHIDSPSGNAYFRVDGTTTTVTFATWTNAANTTPIQSWIRYIATLGAQASELQVCGGVDSQGNVPNTITVNTSWLNENFVPSGFIDKSENIIDAIPFFEGTTEVWRILSDIADAEFAALYFDGDGYPHFRNTRSDVSAVGQTVSKLLTARTNVKNLQYTSSVQQVANSVSVAYTPQVLNINQQAWSATGSLKVPALSTIEFSFTMPGVILEIQGFNLFDGNSAPDGSGAVVPNSMIGWTASGIGPFVIYVTFENLSPFDIWLVDATGQPTPKLNATWFSPTTTNVVPEIRQNLESIRRYQLQPLDIQTSPWRQNQDVAMMWATFLASELGYPKPIIKNVPIVGDPRIELGDLNTLQDINGLGVSGLFRVTAIKNSATDNDGFSQDLTLREAGIVAIWNVNYWDDGSVWGI